MKAAGAFRWTGHQRFTSFPRKKSVMHHDENALPSLARVAASGARLWLLDEPLNALDSEGAERLARLVEAHLASGGAVLAASHQQLPGEWPRVELGR